MATRVLIRLALGLGVLYLALCLLVVVFQRRLMYFPDRHPESQALRRAQALGLASWTDGPGRLLGWRPVVSAKAPLRVLVFHGNAGSALDRQAYADLFPAGQAEVVLFEYPGYGPRGGECTERSLVASALEAFDLLRREGPVLLLGESLGSGVAVQVAAARGDAVAGLLLVTPFARMTEVAGSHYPWLPVRWLLRDRWDGVAVAGRIRCPASLVLAGRDEVVGAAQGHRLADALGGPVKVGIQVQAGHNTLVIRPKTDPWPELLAFLVHPGGDARMVP